MQITYDRGDKLLRLADQIPAQCKPLHNVRGITRNQSLATCCGKNEATLMSRIKPAGTIIVLFEIGLLAILLPQLLSATDFKPIEPASTYQHDRFQTEPRDIIREFRAYITSFDSGDDDDGDGRPDTLAVPQWVAYELRQTPAALGKAPKRPRPWITVDSLHVLRVAPDDDSYKNSGYSRGHMCMKYHAWRLGVNADWNTHTVLNACPQLQALY